MKNQFKTGEYIVIDLNNSRWDGDSWNNMCFLQRKDCICVAPKMDLNNSQDNAWTLISKDSKFWRYATEYEISYYTILNGPYDVTKLVNNNIKQNYNRLLHILKFINNYGNTKNKT